MAQQTINVGTAPNDGTGTPLRTAFQYTNSNFSELYTAVGPSGNNIVVPGNATITGDLTVDTNTLKVDSANNRVYIGTTAAVLSEKFNVSSSSADTYALMQQGSGITALFGVNATGAYSGSYTNQPYLFLANNIEQYRISPLGVFTWTDGAGGTRMTLNSTGLGVGASPQVKLTVRTPHAVATATTYTGGLLIHDEANGIAPHLGAGIAYNGGDQISWIQSNSSTGVYPLALNPAGGEVRIGGNVGIGVTPSAWSSGLRAINFSTNGVLYANGGNSVFFGNNYYNDGAGTNRYLTNNVAAAYGQVTGAHQWFTAASGTAGNPITFTQAMTLDASGNLLLATTTNTPSARQYINQASGSNPALYIAGGASTTPLINFNGAGRMRSDGQYLVMETTNASGVIYITANTNGVYLAVGGTSWTANSDERLKDIIEPISNAVAKVGSLRSVIGKFKNDETNTRRSFLIAQDVQAVLPEAVDASNPDRLGVAYSEVIPLLVAAIKELTARVQTLETR